jgi:TPR repeat protein
MFLPVLLVSVFAGAIEGLFAVAAGTPSLQQGAAQAPRRVALLVGNNAYSDRPLVNALPDANALGRVLRELGFAVTVLPNTRRADFTAALDAFVGRLSPGDIALFYYSGHGFQLEGDNYLAPVDFAATTSADAKRAAYSATEVHRRIAARGVRLTILVLDACRDNLLAVRSAAGWSVMGQAKETYIAFATSPNETASDDQNASNGLFTAQLLKVLEEPGLSLDSVFNRVRGKVIAASNERQVPWSASSVTREFIFRNDGSRTAPPSPNAPLQTMEEVLTLAKSYLTGDDTTRDYAKARALYSWACESGNLKACSNLGVIYDLGRGVPKDLARAIALYQRSCDGQNAEACRNLGLVHEEEDRRELAEQYLSMGCESGSIEACNDLGSLYITEMRSRVLDRVLGSLVTNPVAARRAFGLACRGGSADGCANLGFVYAQMPLPGRAFAEGALRQGCDMGSLPGCWMLGQYYEKISKPDLSKALQFYRLACNGKYEDACTDVKRLERPK